MATSGDDLQVAALRVRLERLERVRAMDAPIDRPDTAAATERWKWGGMPWIAVAGGLTLVTVAAFVAMALQSGSAVRPARGAIPAAVPAIDSVPVLSTSEVALVRARTAVARGRLSDALKELDRVAVDSPDRPTADQLRIDVQQLLMASVRSFVGHLNHGACATMRCPKCHYLGFDPEPRCRNCGYDLEVADADLALHAGEAADDEAELPDLTLHERPNAAAAPVTLELVHAAAGSRSAVAEATGRDDKRGAGSRLTLIEEPIDDEYEEPVRQLEPEPLDADPIEMEPADEPVAPAPALPELIRMPVRAPQTTTEMPLFVKDLAQSDLRAEAMLLTSEDEPVVPPTRPPLAVRRATVEPPRAQPRAERRLGPLDHDLLEDLKRVELEEAVRDRELVRTPMAEPAAMTDERVEPSRRLAAAGIDIAVLGGIGGFVFWATLRLCNVSVSAVGWSALIPFVIFIVVMDLSYLLMFTAAGGQTVGKMLMHLRVVGDDRAPDEPVPMGRAAWRAVLTIVSVVALGLGWLPALFGRGLTLHDRLAHTRVVRV